MANFISYVPHLLSPMFLGYLKRIPEVIAFREDLFMHSEWNSKSSSELPCPVPCWLLQIQITICYSPSPDPVIPASLSSSSILCCLLTSLRPSGWTVFRAQKAHFLSSFTLFAQLQLLLLCHHPAHHFSRGPHAKAQCPLVCSLSPLCFSSNYIYVIL